MVLKAKRQSIARRLKGNISMTAFSEIKLVCLCLVKKMSVVYEVYEEIKSVKKVRLLLI